MVLSDYSRNTRVNIPGNAIIQSWTVKKLIHFHCFVSLLVNAFPWFESLDNLAS